MNYKISVIPGDGVGPEVMQEGLKILDYVSNSDSKWHFDIQEYPWGCEYYEKNGKMMSDNGINELEKSDAILLGAVGYPSVPDHISLWELLLVIRKSFDQYINIRPVKLLKGAPCPIKDKSTSDIDMLFIRENTEGEYAGSGSWLFEGKANEVVIQESVFSRIGCERVIRYAFDLARAKKKTLTSVSKANALNYSMVFWDQIFTEVSKEYPDVKTYSYLVDAASMLMVTQPERFQIVVTSNLFGDILTDLGAAIAGGMGLAAGANINPEKVHPSMFEPIHGSAPDIAGMGIANPLATIWTVGQMLTHFGYPEWEDKIVAAIEKVLEEGNVRTPDLGGVATTSEMGDAIVEALDRVKALSIK